MADSLLNEKEVAERLGRSVKTVQKDRCYGSGPPFVKVGRLVRYRESDVDAYLAALPAYRSTSEVSARRARDPEAELQAG